LCSAGFAQERSELSMPPNGDNQKAEVSQWVGPVKITVTYHSPHVHNPRTVDRTGHIWGELVRYDFFDEGFGPSTAAPWRAGANESTTISFSNDVKIEGQPLKAGTYGLFLAVEKTGPWHWIFSRNSAGWGAYQYDANEDALRVQAVPQDAPFTEFLTYGFDDRHPDSAVAFLQWENKRIPLKIEVPNVNALYVDRMRSELLSWPGFNYRNWQTAAQFCADKKINLEEALTWADKAITVPFRGASIGHEEFGTLQTKAAVLEAMGRTAEADTLMQKAIRLPGTEAVQVYRYGTTLLRSGKKAEAMQIFEMNRQQHPADKFWVSLGLASGYTAQGDKQSAIANWEIVLKNVPESLANNIPRFTEALRKLKESN
jgi:hypothetical protein